ncbi:hypothetical protein [Saccharospirillum salsuginis]|uniref:Uncharacterized protein n=1 Tax=Saccharospirillum salsuginis TaxID=418750 RepID=A0A918K3A0_9GAMM|nr:hypothetical protein [Saccharospirillum salsuginis]GGX45111.1 hypothetical protein GCM10007392_09940 [Saccharospirillum salsuginis]
MDHPFVLMFFFLILFVAGTELLRRYRHAAMVLFLLSLPVLLVPNGNGLFMQIKTVSVLVPICFLIYARVNAGALKPVSFLIYGVIILNIVEASVIDMMTGNYLNLAAGLGLILLLPRPGESWRVAGRHRNFELALPTYWPFLYTTWNLCFLYSARISTFGYAIPLLLAPFLYAVALRRSDWYFQARAYSFGGYLFFRAAFGDTAPLNLDSFDLTDWYSPTVALAWGAVNLAITGYCLYPWCSNRITAFYDTFRSKQEG